MSWRLQATYNFSNRTLAAGIFTGTPSTTKTLEVTNCNKS